MTSTLWVSLNQQVKGLTRQKSWPSLSKAFCQQTTFVLFLLYQLFLVHQQTTFKFKLQLFPGSPACISNQTLNFPSRHNFSSVWFSSVAQSCPTLCNPMNCSMPGLPVHHQLPEFTQTHIHLVGDAIQPFQPLSSPSPPASNPSQPQNLFQLVNALHEVAKVLEFQL